jgi:hypothetical protein
MRSAGRLLLTIRHTPSHRPAHLLSRDNSVTGFAPQIAALRRSVELVSGKVHCMFFITSRRAIAHALAVTLLGVSVHAWGQRVESKNPIQKVGKYAVELRVPAEGLFAGEEIDVEFRVTDTSQDDPVQGAPPVVNAKVAADVTMPSMPGMPAQKPKTHTEGVPGDYGVALYFPHGGEYRVALNITPPGDKPFAVAFKVGVGDPRSAGKGNPKPQPYLLEVTSSPSQPKAGEPADLTISVRSRETKKPVTDFDVVHERLIHFIIVSRDLSQFSHEHPEMGADGKFTLRYTFPTGGEYRLFADTAPKGAGSVVVMQPIKVAGPLPAAVQALTPNSAPSAIVDGVKVAMKPAELGFSVGRTIPVAFSLADARTGAPVTDIQPWLGAVAHLILIHEDATTFVHCHPDEADPNNGKTGQITFNARFPKLGVYRGWLQFQRADKVETAAFTVAAGAVKTLGQGGARN